MAEELARLHRGRGVHADDLPARLGPHLAAVVFGDVGPDRTGAAELVKRWLAAASAELPADLRTIFQRASGLADQQPFLTERLTSLATSTGLSTRTLMRRLGDANALVAAGMDRRTHTSTDDNPFAGRGWYVDRLESAAYLDEGPPRFVGTREILVTLDGLESICESLSIPQPPGEPQPAELLVVATEGCVLGGLERVSPSTWKVSLVLPRPLLVGDRHRLGLSITMPSRSFIKPYNAFVPVRRTRSFAAQVYAAPGQLTRAWRVDGVPPPALEDGVPVGELFDLDRPGPLAAEWDTVRRGLGYGIGWTWAG